VTPSRYRPRRRGLALGLNQSAGYGGVALAAGLSGWLAADFAARDVLVVAGAIVATVAFLLSVLFVCDTPHTSRWSRPLRRWHR
jgi:nitrate/nitrite transporter NarK